MARQVPRYAKGLFRLSVMKLCICATIILVTATAGSEKSENKLGEPDIRHQKGNITEYEKIMGSDKKARSNDSIKLSLVVYLLSHMVTALCFLELSLNIPTERNYNLSFKMSLVSFTFSSISFLVSVRSSNHSNLDFSAHLIFMYFDMIQMWFVLSMEYVFFDVRGVLRYDRIQQEDEESSDEMEIIDVPQILDFD